MKKLALFLLAIACASRLDAAQRPRITGIAQVRLYTSDAGASAAFYGKVLGMDQKQADDAAVYEVNSLQSIAVSSLPSPAPAWRLASIVFRTTDAAGLQKFLREHAVTITEPLEHGTFGVRDPEDNLVFFTDVLKNAAPVSSRAPSQRIIHAGHVVKDRDAEDRFYRDLLGFHVYWQGGRADGRLDYVAMQVPDGSDWLEYMLNVPIDATAKQLGGSNHFSLGVDHMADVVAALQRNGCEGESCSKTQLGRDGKVQLNVFDPDLTRAEYMEFVPTRTPCCSPILGKIPTDKEDQ